MILHRPMERTFSALHNAEACTDPAISSRSGGPGPIRVAMFALSMKSALHLSVSLLACRHYLYRLFPHAAPTSLLMLLDNKYGASHLRTHSLPRFLFLDLHEQHIATLPFSSYSQPDGIRYGQYQATTGDEMGDILHLASWRAWCDLFHHHSTFRSSGLIEFPILVRITVDIRSMSSIARVHHNPSQAYIPIPPGLWSPMMTSAQLLSSPCSLRSLTFLSTILSIHHIPSCTNYPTRCFCLFGHHWPICYKRVCNRGPKIVK